MKKMFFSSIVLILSVLIGRPSALAQQNKFLEPYTGSEPDTLLLWHFDSPSEKLDSGPSGHNLRAFYFSASVTPGKFGDAYTNPDSDGYTVSDTAQQVFGPVGHTDGRHYRVIEFWYKPFPEQFDESGNFRLYAGQETNLLNLVRGNGGAGIQFIVGTNTARMWDSWCYPPSAYSPYLTWAPNVWYHLAYEHIDSVGTNLYRDGVCVKNTTLYHNARFSNPNGSLYLGDYIGYRKDGLVGQMDEFRISDTHFEPPKVALLIEGEPLVVNELGETSDTFTVAPHAMDGENVIPPQADVIVVLDPDINGDDIKLNNQSPGASVTLTFTLANWQTPQTVTVAAVDDALPECGETAQIVFTLSCDDGDPNSVYDEGYVPNLPVTVVDDECAGILLDDIDGSLAVNESGATTDAYTVVLQSDPIQNVTIVVNGGMVPKSETDPNLVPKPLEQVTVNGGSTATLTFTTSDWDTPQTVTVQAIDDAVLETDPHTEEIHHTAQSLDPQYEGLSDTITVTVNENECGAWGFHPFDKNENCYVDIWDLYEFATGWLVCTVPQDSQCTDAYQP